MNLVQIVEIGVLDMASLLNAGSTLQYRHREGRMCIQSPLKRSACCCVFSVAVPALLATRVQVTVVEVGSHPLSLALSTLP